MHWPSFFSWKIETVLFFLAEKEKNGFKKLPQSARSAGSSLLVEGGLVSLNVYVVIDMVDAIAVVTVAL